MKNLIGLLLSLTLVGCADSSGSSQKLTVKPEWIEYFSTCPYGVSAYADQVSQVFRSCLNSDTAKSIQSLVQLEAYVFSCIQGTGVTNLQFNSDNEVLVSYNDGVDFCQNKYQR